MQNSDITQISVSSINSEFTSDSPGSKGEDCADLSTSMKFGTDVDQNILNSFFEGAEAGASWGHHICQIQYGR